MIFWISNAIFRRGLCGKVWEPTSIPNRGHTQRLLLLMPSYHMVHISLETVCNCTPRYWDLSLFIRYSSFSSTPQGESQWKFSSFNTTGHSRIAFHDLDFRVLRFGHSTPEDLAVCLSLCLWITPLAPILWDYQSLTRRWLIKVINWWVDLRWLYSKLKYKPNLQTSEGREDRGNSSVQPNHGWTYPGNVERTTFNNWIIDWGHQVYSFRNDMTFNSMKHSLAILFLFGDISRNVSLAHISTSTLDLVQHIAS